MRPKFVILLYLRTLSYCESLNNCLRSICFNREQFLFQLTFSAIQFVSIYHSQLYSYLSIAIIKHLWRTIIWRCLLLICCCLDSQLSNTMTIIGKSFIVTTIVDAFKDLIMKSLKKQRHKNQ